MRSIESIVRSLVVSVEEYGRLLRPPVSRRRATELCQQQRVPGAFQMSGAWLVPRDAPDPRKPVGRPTKYAIETSTDP